MQASRRGWVQANTSKETNLSSIRKLFIKTYLYFDSQIRRDIEALG